MPIRSTELELTGTATIHAIEPVSVLPGEGALVTGRFRTRRVEQIVTAAVGGERVSGTPVHPVWRPVQKLNRSENDAGDGGGTREQ